MKMIFESLLLDKVQEDINLKLTHANYDKNSAEYAKELNKISNQETFNYYKVRS